MAISWLGSLFGGGVGDVVESIGNVADRFITSGEEKQAFKLELERLLQSRDQSIQESIQSEILARERVLVAELQQGDSYTKRARPTVVYAGLGFIFFNYCIAPLFAAAPFILPGEFWLGWTGIVATWSIGRTMERRGNTSPVVEKITGTSRLLS